MHMLRKYGFALLIYLLSFFAVPYLLLANIDDGFRVVIISLILINSITVFLVTCYMTYKYGLDWIHLLTMIILYLLSCFVVWNSSAIIYLVLYIIVAGIALLLGYLFRKKLPSNAKA